MVIQNRLTSLVWVILLVRASLLHGQGVNSEDFKPEIKYSTTDVPWQESLGNHRAVLRVTADAGCALLHLDWRRHDREVGRHRFIIRNAETGAEVANIHRYAVNNEFCEIAFGPVTAGTYHFYYLPVDVSAGWTGYGDEFVKPEPAPSKKWLAENRISSGDKNLPVQAECVEIQSRSAFDSFFPMEVIATEQEKRRLIDTSSASFLLFPEDRKYPIRMLDNIPQKWIRHPSPDRFTGSACRNEYYVFQIGLWALEKIENISMAFYGLEGLSGSIPASAFTCFNLSGIDPRGKLFTKRVDVEKLMVQPLWIGIDIPENVEPGRFTGKILVKTENAGEKSIGFKLDITGEILPDRGDGDLWRHSRLRWLNSTAGIDDNNVKPYEPLRWINEKTVALTGKEIRFGNDGMPVSIQVAGKEVLAAPVQFTIDSDGNSGRQSVSEQKILKSAPGIAIREVARQEGNFDVLIHQEIESDGYLKFIVTVTPLRDAAVSDIRLTIPFRKDHSGYLMGMGRPGSATPDRLDAKWKKPQDAFWIGNTSAGLHCELRGALYTGPLLNLYQPGFPESWHNGGEGGFRIETNGMARNAIVYSGSRKFKSGEPILFEWAFLITPVKQENTEDHFTNRYYHNYPDPDPKPEDLKDGFYGIRVINLHHANRYNPFINYPFLADDELISFINRFHAMNIKAKIYYTIREVSNNMTEIWAMRSLGTEIFRGTSGGGNPWLQEHLVSDYSPSWYERIDSVRKDAALVTSAGSSRWYNYYIEGLKWMVRKYGIDGLYLDDVAFDRNMLKRMRKVMEAEKPGCLIDLHSNTGFSIGPAIQYTEFFPYIDKIWFGEGFHYTTLTPEQWLVEVSGIPFGLMNDMLGVAGDSPWKGMVYGMTTRYPWGTVKVACNPYDIWKVWDSFAIGSSEMTGYWEENPAVSVSSPEIRATAFLRQGKILISLASWSDKPLDAILKVDLKRAGLDPDNVKITAPAIPNFQEERHFRYGDPIPVEPSKVWLLVVEPMMEQKK